MPQHPPFQYSTGANNHRITCSGGIAAMDMMAHLISKHTNLLLATAVSDMFIHGRVRKAKDMQKVLLPTDNEHTPLELLGKPIF